MEKIFNKSAGKNRRQSLRNEMTLAEKILWFYLKGHRLDGYKFRRQQGIGKYIVDFYCSSNKLVIEIDGDSHYLPGAPRYDQKRQEYIESLGLTILRFTNTETYSTVTEVLGRITKELNNHP